MNPAERHQAQARAAEPLMENLLARLRNLAGELESRGWQCEVIDGSWVFTLPQKGHAMAPGDTVIRADDSGLVPLTGEVTGWATRDHEKVYVLWGTADTATAEYASKLRVVTPG
jgi:hypothetical protein